MRIPNSAAVISASHKAVGKVGQGIGLGLGVAVTEGLAFSKKWNAPLLNPQGQPVQSIPGANRIGNHDIRVRHQEVVGPQVAAKAAKLPPGFRHDFLEGVGRGATAAPGTSYRLESRFSDFFTAR
jgi:hypothetical protein